MMSHACNCVGPQNGDPVCPCMMRGVSVRNGRYVREEDLGPVAPPLPKVRAAKFCDQCGEKLLTGVVHTCPEYNG